MEYATGPNMPSLSMIQSPVLYGTGTRNRALETTLQMIMPILALGFCSGLSTTKRRRMQTRGEFGIHQP
ncbi:hypothetical protein MVEN_00872800 [Mycena venus]|uniref:Uncharacterized protein n=1 Tax=Mycena venus TaxID=2733690 RepID=A0A8H7D176_9AGAR|nr:hypothetical protein MVEN_00872800 [Mycena venus]